MLWLDLKSAGTALLSKVQLAPPAKNMHEISDSRAYFEIRYCSWKMNVLNEMLIWSLFMQSIICNLSFDLSECDFLVKITIIDNEKGNFKCLSLWLEKEETLKYRFVSSNLGRTHKCDFSVFDWKYPFLAYLVQKIKFVSLGWNLVSRLIRICIIQWWSSFYSF